MCNSCAPKPRWSNFSQVLQLEEHFAIGTFTITVNHRFAFFVVFGQRPGRDL